MQLSETESRVVQLVARGLSNREVAAQLFVTVRAVESTLIKAYAKLGVRSRTELAARMQGTYAARLTDPQAATGGADHPSRPLRPR
jgi:DNA-binding NarL/FixJ family response regulator